MYKMHNKKAGVAIEELSGLLVFMFVAVLVILFFTFVKFIGEEKKTSDVKGHIEMLDADDALLYFLKMPIEKDLKDNIADFILQSYIDDDYEKLENLVNDHFNNVYGDTNTPWNFEVTTPSGRPVLFIGGGIQKKTGGFRASYLTTLQHHTVVTIPSHGARNVDYLEVRFSSGMLKPES